MNRKLLHSEILEERLTEPESLAIERHPVSLLLHNIRSSYNVGSIFRTADSALLNKIIMTGFTPHPPKKEIEKTALGAIHSVPWEYENSAENAVEKLKEQGIKVFALELTDKKRLYDSLEISDFPCCIVLGNELSGIDQNIIDLCDDSIEIPMYGVKHSLNVSVACGIAVYEAVKIWHSFNK